VRDILITVFRKSAQLSISSDFNNCALSKFHKSAIMDNIAELSTSSLQEMGNFYLACNSSNSSH